MGFFSNLFKLSAKTNQEISAAAGNISAPYQFAQMNGDKFVGGYGDTQLLYIDYWTLRNRSIQLYNENLYAEGIINAFVTNIINTGLTLECTPSETILGIDSNALNDWTEDVETRFKLYGDNPALVDFYGERTYGQIQAQRELQALVEGDVLTVYHFDNKTMMPKIQLISSSCIQSPVEDKKIKDGHTVTHGVEKDASGRVVAYWVVKVDGKYERYPKFGARSGRRIANLYIPGKNLMDHVRGMPLLANVLQSLREIDRYRDSVQRKALATSFLALAVEKDADTISGKVLGGASNRSLNVTGSDDYKLNLKQFNPGVFIDDMPAGHKIKMMGSDGTDLSFGDFEAAIINAIAWTKECPPEVIKKSFSSNYAASKQANAEFKMFLDFERTALTKANDHPFYAEWLHVEVIKGNIQAPGLIDAWNDPEKYAIKGAWISADFSGGIKPNADLVKEAAGQKLMLEIGATTRDRVSKTLTGSKFSTNVKRLARENEQLAQAMRPMLQLQQEFGAPQVDAVMAAVLQHEMIGADNAVSE